jgi:long-chain fatty acid transport protein
MKQKKLLAGALCVAASLAAQTVLGAGFGIYEGSARSSGMGTEVTADPVAPSVIYNNPAAMTALEGTQFEVGAGFIGPSVTVVAEQTPFGTVETTSEDNWYAAPRLYATHQYNETIWLGFGVFSRFGLGNEYKDDWVGRYNVRKALIRSLEMNPSVAVKVMDNLSLAAGVRAQWFSFQMDTALPTGTPFADPDLNLRIEGDNWGIGYNLGAFYQATEWLSFGISYDSEVKQEIEGEYTARSPVGTVASAGGADGDVTTPALLRVGASAQATEKLKLNAGIVYTMWSSYDELAISFDPVLLGRVPGTSTQKDWDDVLRYQVGAEYALTEVWALRAGYVYDRTPDPDDRVDYTSPSNDRHIFSLGVGYAKNNFSCDLGYTYLFMEDRDVAARPEESIFSGEFTDLHAHTFGIAFGYKL